jgi:hypothetical protein
MESISPKERDKRQSTMIADTVELADDVGERSALVGYITMAFYSDGTSRSAGLRPNGEEHRIGCAMFEAWARQQLEKHFMYGEGVDATYAVLNDQA